jgi:hypothetical protein
MLYRKEFPDLPCSPVMAGGYDMWVKCNSLLERSSAPTTVLQVTKLNQGVEEVRMQLRQATPGSSPAVDEAALASLNRRIDDLTQQLNELRATAKGVLCTRNIRDVHMYAECKLVPYNFCSRQVSNDTPLETANKSDINRNVQVFF